MGQSQWLDGNSSSFGYILQWRKVVMLTLVHQVGVSKDMGKPPNHPFE